MINILNSTNVCTIDLGNGKRYTFPKGVIIATQNDNSDTVNIKLKASRKTILSINYKNVSSPSSSSSEELISLLNSYFY